MRKRSHERIENPVADHTARGAGGRPRWIYDRAGRRLDRNAAHVAFAAGNVVLHDTANCAVGRGVDHRDRTVDGGVDLRRRAGKVDLDPVGVDLDGYLDLQRLRVGADTIYVVDMGEASFAQLIDGGPHAH